jgi:hypothetical protein
MNLPLLLDTTPIFAFQQYLKEHDFPVSGNPNYIALVDALRDEFPGEEFKPKFAFVAVSFDNEGQKKFLAFLQHPLGFLVDATDYRDAFILPDRSSPYQRLSTRITYVAGMLAQKKPHIVVVTDAFDVYYPLLDLVQTRGCRVTLAFFRSALEHRWQRVGLFNADCAIKFLDLDRYAKAIIGADLASSSGTSLAKTGLGSFKF